MADGLTGRVLDTSRAAACLRVGPTAATTRPSIASALLIAVVAAVLGRWGSAPPARAGRTLTTVLAVVVAAAVVVLGAWRPAVSACREHRYDARWSRQPLGW